MHCTAAPAVPLVRLSIAAVTTACPRKSPRTSLWIPPAALRTSAMGATACALLAGAPFVAIAVLRWPLLWAAVAAGIVDESADVDGLLARAGEIASARAAVAGPNLALIKRGLRAPLLEDLAVPTPKSLL